jgi:site-specific recombinase XerD
MTAGKHVHGGEQMGKRDEPGSIWTDILLPRNPLDKRNYRRRSQQDVVIKLLREHHRDLYKCQEGALLTPDQSKELVLRLAGKGGDYDFKHRMHYLVRGLEAGKEKYGWNVVIPAVPSVVPREKARFTPDSFIGMATARSMRNTFVENLREPAPDTRDSRIGQILISAVLFGGLLQRRWLEPFLNALPYPRTDGTLLWLEMLWVYHELPPPDRTENRKKFVKRVTYQEKVEWTVNRRWVADPLTALLIVRWLRDFPEDNVLTRNVITAEPIANSYFSKSKAIVPLEYRRTLSALITDTITLIGLKIPPYLASYAAGSIKSVSLPDEVWTRVLTEKAVPRLTETSEIEESPAKVFYGTSISADSSVHSARQQELLLRDMLKVIHNSTSSQKQTVSHSMNELRIFLSDNKNALSPILELVGLWGYDLLTHYPDKEILPSQVKKTLKPSTVRRYLQPVADGLLCQALDLKLLELTSEDFYELYLDIIKDRVTDLDRVTTGHHLARFHEFLVFRHGFPAVDFSDLIGRKGPMELGVDANFITPYQFSRVLKLLQWQKKDLSPLRIIQIIITLLGYRCGLRNREALKLRVKDVHGSERPELLVRVSKYAYLKSSDSVRRIPLYILFTEIELEFFRKWLAKRVLEYPREPNEALLFCNPNDPTTPLAEGSIFPFITDALHQATGERSLVYHHLRHSCATLLLICLTYDDTGPKQYRLPFLDHPDCSPARRESLAAGLLYNNRHGRQALFVVSQLLGHAGPEVTLLHYCHLLEWQLAASLSHSRCEPIISLDALKQLTGRQSSWLYQLTGKNWRASSCLHLILKELHAKHPDPMDILGSKAKSEPIPDKTPKQARINFEWHIVYEILHCLAKGEGDEISLSRKFAVPIEIIQQWQSRAETIFSLKSSGGVLRNVTESSVSSSDKFPFPRRLVHEEENILITTIIQTVSTIKSVDLDFARHKAWEFANSFRINKRENLYPTIRPARSFLRFVRLIGTPETGIFLFHRISVTEPEGRAQLESHWLHRLEIPRDRIFPQPGAYRPSMSIDIRIAPEGFTETEKGKVLKSNAGFRHALYLILILYGLPDGNSMATSDRDNS